jgi:hypothetical protein
LTSLRYPITPEQQKLVIDIILGRISYEEFARSSGLDPAGQPDFAARALEETLTSQDGVTLECVLLLVERFDRLTADLAPLLATLLLQPWHYKHEDIARYLQELCIPATADALALAVLVKHDYLANNDSHAVARKCIWALADIGTPEARNHLEHLAHTPDPEIAYYAKKRLDNWQDELQRKGQTPSE